MNFWSLLTVLFIGLKLANIIDWSWFWVLSPILIPILMFFCASLFAVIIAAMFNR
jgi:hypothetical protein